MSRRATALFAAAFFFALPALAQEAEPQEEAPRMIAASWCAVHFTEPQEGDLGCDVGIGAALFRWRRAFLAGVVGTQTLGVGIGWTAYRSESVTVAAAFGVIAPYGERGINAGEWAPAIGCTFALGGGGE